MWYLAFLFLLFSLVNDTFRKIFYFMNVFHACMHVHAWCSQRLEEGIRSSGTGVVDSFELPGEFWELNLGIRRLLC